MRKGILQHVAVLGATMALVACSSASDLSSEGVDQATGAAEALPPSDLSLCAAIRGNGDYLFAHFGALARIVEHYGLVNGVAGGSSGSITSFLYESMLKNPAVAQCGERPCSEEERALRTALLLKSFTQYMEEFSNSEEGQAISHLSDLGSEVKSALAERDIKALLSVDVRQAAKEVETIVSRLHVPALISKELIDSVRVWNPRVLKHNVQEAYEGLKLFGTWTFNDPRVFLRPGVVDFEGATQIVGRIGDFYAGYGPHDAGAFGRFLDACSGPTKGMLFPEIGSVPAGEATCGILFSQLVAGYRQRAREAEYKFPHRMDELVDSYGPLRTIISTAVFPGEAGRAMGEAKREFVKGKYDEADFHAKVHFSDVRFGYWASPSTLERVGRNERGYQDAKTARFYPIGQQTWKEVISRSAAEPSLAPAQSLPNGAYSIGGWSDLLPTLVLKNAGCERVIYIQRRAEAESPIIGDVARVLKASPEEAVAMNDYKAKESNANVSISEADGVLCTNWNVLASGQIREMTADGYNAPVELHGKALGRGKFSVCEQASEAPLGFSGCTPVARDASR